MAPYGQQRTTGAAAAAAARAARAAAANESHGDKSTRSTYCVVGFRFLKTVHGLLNIVSIIVLLGALIAGGLAGANDAHETDKFFFFSNVLVSAVHTRNAVIVFAIFGLILMVADTILHVTRLILRLPPNFDLTFIITMFIFAAIYFVLGCCAAAWQKKTNDIVARYREVKNKGAPAAAAFFFFVATGTILWDFILRLVRPPATKET